MTYYYQDGKLLLRIHLQTGARQDAIGGLYAERLRVRIKARPIAGKANQYLIAYIAKEFAVSQSNVSILAGLRSRDKTLCIKGRVDYPEWFLTLRQRIEAAGRDSAKK